MTHALDFSLGRCSCYLLRTPCTPNGTAFGAVKTNLGLQSCLTVQSEQAPTPFVHSPKLFFSAPPYLSPCCCVVDSRAVWVWVGCLMTGIKTARSLARA
eukprot:677063-Rhodomonas_salina.2